MLILSLTRLHLMFRAVAAYSASPHNAMHFSCPDHLILPSTMPPPTEDTSMSDHSWSGGHFHWICVHWSGKVHHNTVNFITIIPKDINCMLHLLANS